MAEEIAVLLDMDGTLIDSRDTVVTCMRAALADLGHLLPEAESLDWMIGPPLIDTIGALLARWGDDRVEECQLRYREHYARHMDIPSPLFPGVGAALEGLAASGRRLYLATSKALPVARTLLDAHRLSGLFSGFYGAGLDDRNSEKPEIIAAALREQGIDPARAVMVGDRRFDIAGAQANKVRALGVLWGYGGREELSAAGADGLVATPPELPAAVAAMFADA